MPRYGDIIPKIKSPGRYHDAKSHLGDEKNMLFGYYYNAPQKEKSFAFISVQRSVISSASSEDVIDALHDIIVD